MSRDKVVLVDINDNVIGEMDKLEAHKTGTLHRAFSVFIFNNKGEMLNHQRAETKYHGAGLWSNTCCSHPQLNEDIKVSAKERLNYEMGIQCDLDFKFSFIYNIPVENKLTEHELDHVYFGIYNSDPVPNPEEVKGYKWISPLELKNEIETKPELYTFWFKQIFANIFNELINDSKKK